jgi:TRAP transporter TAXI family solute receptor
MAMRIGRLVAFTSIALVLSTVAWAAESEMDPASVSESLKAIFKYNSGKRDIIERLNAHTVTLISGTIGGTYVQFGADLASALDDGDNLPVLSIIGRGSVQSIADILFLKGVDLGIVRSDTLDYLEKKGYASNIKKQLTYITKLYNEEMHVVAPKTIRTLSDLEGKKVAVDLPNGGTFVTSAIVFERLGIKADFVYIEQRLAYEKLKRGEIDAMIAVQGKPSKFTTTIKDAELHLVPVAYDKSLQPDYLPTVLTSDDYPNLIEAGQQIDTVAVPALLAAFNWPPNSERYRKVARFVGAFFDNIPVLQKPPFHPKWKEVAVHAPVPGWSRFQAAQEWLDRTSIGMVAPKGVGMASTKSNGGVASSAVRRTFERFLNERNRAPSRAAASSEDRDVLFRQFLEWQKKQSAGR